MHNKNTDEGLKRVVGLPAFAMSIVNNSVGSGIFALPALISLQLGAFSIFCYLFCSIMLAAIMLCYAEVGSKVTSSGGSYAYIEAAFGPVAGFIANWLYTFGWGILGSAAVMNILADSLSVLFPVFTNPVIRAMLFVVLLGIMVLVNIIGAKDGARFVQLLTIIKILPLLAIIIFGISHIKAANLQWQQLPTIKTFADTALVLFYAFAGFETSLGICGEIKQPQHTIPLGILIGGAVVLFIYLSIQTVTQGVLGNQVAAFKDAPLAAVAGKIVGPIGATLLVVAAVISCFGITSGDVMATPRLLFAGAKDGLFPKLLGNIHQKFATPSVAISVYALLIFILAVSGGFRQLAVLASAAILLIYLAVILATIKLRNVPQENGERTFRIPGGLTIPFIGIAAIIWLLASLTGKEIVAAIVFITAVGIVYFLMKRLQKSNVVAKVV